MHNRDTARIRAYHDATKHSAASVYGQRHTLDWPAMPRPFKVYPELEPIALPRDFMTSTRPALAALADAATAVGDGPALDRAAIARLLFFSAGVLHRRAYPGGEIYFRAAACTGALYHIDLYLVCGMLPDLEAAVYHFGPHDFALRRLRAGDHRAIVVAATAGHPAVATAPALLLFTTTFWRNAWKYRARAYRHAFWDSGTILANLLALAAAVALPAEVVLGFVDDDLDRLLDLDPRREVTLGVVALGRGAPSPPAAPPAPPLGLATLPPSAREVDYPAIREAHAAGVFDTGEEVAAWGGALAPHLAVAGTEPAVWLAPAAADAARQPIEAAILRRGSSRAFAPEPIPAAALATVLWSATRGIAADFVRPGAPLADLYLIVNAVDGVAPGAYVFDRTRCALALLQRGEFRRLAGHLGLDQSLPAEAAVDVFWLTDLGPVLERFGNRGYRAAQLEAAIEGGKAYLTAYVLGLGATGLTFFDDEVTAFLSPHAAGKSVMFLVALGRARRARA